MLTYSLSNDVEAFSTTRDDALDFDVLLPLHQAHSSRAVRVPADDEAITGVDALVTNRRGLLIGVKTADCVPVLLHDPVGRAVAAVHSGWRGTVQNIIASTVQLMRSEFATDPRRLTAVIGPCIHQEAFEVSDDVYERFAAAGHAACARRMDGLHGVRWHIDLPAVCAAQLHSLGVTSVTTRPECTYTLHTRFWSARRLGAAFGSQRILNCIRLK